MKRFASYLVIAKLLFVIYLLVAKQRFYLTMKRLQHRLVGRREATTTS